MATTANREVWRQALLGAGIASSLFYALMIWAIRYQGYSLLSQVPSELTAIGAPTQQLWAWLGPIYTLLVTAFGWGVWRSAGRDRRLRIVGGLILAFGALGLLWPFAPMHQREVLAAGGGTLGDTLHRALGGVTVFFMFLTIGFGAALFGRRFRLYSLVTIVVLLAFGALTFLESSRLEAGLPTPWIGLWERINISVFLLWILVLATMLLRGRVSTPREGQARFVAVYNAALKQWPVSYEELDVATPFGMTHVVAAGTSGAPPLVLLHGYMATSVMWAPNIADFTRDHRVYAIDTMGQPGKSVPGDPIRNSADYIAWLTATLDGLNLGRVSLVGMSFGGWLALRYAVSAPARIERLVLLSPGGFLPMAKSFALRGMLMAFVPTRFTVNSFMRWAGFRGTDVEPVLDLMYLGAKYFQMPKETLRASQDAGIPVSDTELRNLRMPVLLMFGADEVIYDAVPAFERARRLIPSLDGDLIPDCRHDMCVSRSRIVNARVLDFLLPSRAPDHSAPAARSIA